MALPGLVLTDATLLTLDDGDSVTGATAVTGGLITAVGADEDVRASAGPGTEVEKAHRNGFQVFAHVNGDAAIDSQLDGHRAAVAAGTQPVVPTVPIHSQVMRLDQLDASVGQGWEPSMFTVHTYLFGDTHVENLGRERADGTSPTRSALDGGLRPSNHSDHPITPINPLEVVGDAIADVAVVLTGNRGAVVHDVM